MHSATVGARARNHGRYLRSRRGAARTPRRGSATLLAGGAAGICGGGGQFRNDRNDRSGGGGKFKKKRY